MGQHPSLLEIVRTLRGPQGCPWDRAQTSESLRPYLLEEAHEVLEAIDRGDAELLQKELGDLLFVVELLAQIEEERGSFTRDGMVAAIVEKMVRRHPHVFQSATPAAESEGTIAAWEARKSTEHGADRSILDGVPKALPSLLRAHRITEKASSVGFDWPDARSVRTKLDEEIQEMDEALASGDPERIGDEFGDVLFTLVNLGRFLPTASEDALRIATNKFERRFRAIEDRLRAEGRSVHETDVDTLEALWNAVKRESR
jgi:MazG family protein